MANSSTTIRARIDAVTKERAALALDQMGLTMSDLIRMTVTKVANEGRVPFQIETPNQTTRAAIDAVQNGDVERFDGVEALMKDLDE